MLGENEAKRTDETTKEKKETGWKIREGKKKYSDKNMMKILKSVKYEGREKAGGNQNMRLGHTRKVRKKG